MRRRVLLQQLAETLPDAGTGGVWETCTALCFQVLYGLPWEIQLQLACFMAERYLPIFTAKHPRVRWPGELLADIPGWHSAHGRKLPDDAEPRDMADNAYASCFDGILHAYHHREHPASVASASCYAISEAAHARAINVWIADDPEGALLWDRSTALTKDGEPFPGHDPSCDALFTPAHLIQHNAAYLAVAAREWAVVSEQLRAELSREHPEPDDLNAVARVLSQLQQREFEPISPSGGWRGPDDLPPGCKR